MVNSHDIDPMEHVSQYDGGGWKSTGHSPPKAWWEVETLIANPDGRGIRNHQSLKLHENGRLWFHPDGAMYVYYTPTHWRPLWS